MPLLQFAPPVLKPPQPCFLITLTERQQTQAYKNPVTNKQHCSASPMFINETACLDRKVALDTVQKQQLKLKSKQRVAFWNKRHRQPQLWKAALIIYKATTM